MVGLCSGQGFPFVGSLELKAPCLSSLKCRPQARVCSAPACGRDAPGPCGAPSFPVLLSAVSALHPLGALRVCWP